MQTNTVRFHLCEGPIIVKFIESESTLVDAWDWEVREWDGDGESVFNRDRVSI